MKSLKTRTGLVMSVCGLLLSASDTSGMDISGTISSTLTIYEHSKLVDNVTCAVAGGQCIQFGAPDIKLELNGFTMTGPSNPPDNCVTTTNFLPEDGIAAVGQTDIEILGPGLLQRFRRHGMFLAQSAKVQVKYVTSSHNCFSGLQMAQVSDSDIQENVSVRNAGASGPFPCGGNCISNSHNNRIRKNHFSGNGSAGPPSNDFGLGLVGPSSDNLIEENRIGGNVNGILIMSAAKGNVISKNIIAGNPPVQVSALFGAGVGADIQDLSPAGANTFKENLCVTYIGAGPPCPNALKIWHLRPHAYAGRRSGDGFEGEARQSRRVSD